MTARHALTVITLAALAAAPVGCDSGSEAEEGSAEEAAPNEEEGAEAAEGEPAEGAEEPAIEVVDGKLTAEWRGSFGTDEFGRKCMELALANGMDKPIGAFNVAYYAYGEDGSQLGDRYEYTSLAPPEPLPAGGTREMCLGDVGRFPAEPDHVDVVAYRAAFEGGDEWEMDIPDQKDKGEILEAE